MLIVLSSGGIAAALDPSNTQLGNGALANVMNGADDTALGVQALRSNTTGTYNTASGLNAMYSNTSGVRNTAAGANALLKNTTGDSSTADGVNALYSNTTGLQNTAIGGTALFNNTSGQRNIGVGFQAGYNLATGNNNIEVGNVELAADANTTRLGTQGTQTATYIAGITNSIVNGVDVVIDSAGRLGTATFSSARYKKDISDMGNSTDGLMKLRPVTFRYKTDQQGTKQYGLIAEEVDRVYPELVVHDADGKVMAVRYSMLTSMLLNELQKQTRKNERQARRIDQLAGQVAEVRISTQQQLAEQRTAFERRLATLERTMTTGSSSAGLVSLR